MQNILEILKELGIEVPTEKETDLNKKVSENYKTIAEHSNKVKKLEDDVTKYKTDYETAKATLDGFDGKDFDAITKERDEWKSKVEEAEKKYKEQIEKRDYEDAVNKAVEGINFSSNSAKKAFVSDLLADPLKMKDGSLLGFNDYVEQYKKSDASAFVTEQDNNQAQFTQQMNGNGNQNVSGDPNKMDFATYKKWREQNK